MSTKKGANKIRPSYKCGADAARPPPCPCPTSRPAHGAGEVLCEPPGPVPELAPEPQQTPEAALLCQPLRAAGARGAPPRQAAPCGGLRPLLPDSVALFESQRSAPAPLSWDAGFAETLDNHIVADGDRTKVQHRPQGFDEYDYIRVYLKKHRMVRTLTTYEHEWSELQLEQNAPANKGVWDCFKENRLLRKQVEEARAANASARDSLDELRRELDSHRTALRDMGEEEENLVRNFERLRLRLQEEQNLVRDLVTENKLVKKDLAIFEAWAGTLPDKLQNQLAEEFADQDDESLHRWPGDAGRPRKNSWSSSSTGARRSRSPSASSHRTEYF